MRRRRSSSTDLEIYTRSCFQSMPQPLRDIHPICCEYGGEAGPKQGEYSGLNDTDRMRSNFLAVRPTVKPATAGSNGLYRCVRPATSWANRPLAFWSMPAPASSKAVNLISPGSTGKPPTFVHLPCSRVRKTSHLPPVFTPPRGQGSALVSLFQIGFFSHGFLYFFIRNAPTI